MNDNNLRFVARAYVDAERRIDAGTDDRLDRDLVKSMRVWANTPEVVLDAAMKRVIDGR